jgi:hypothetical protein
MGQWVMINAILYYSAGTAFAGARVLDVGFLCFCFNNCLSGNVEHRCHAIITADQRKFPNDLSAHLWCLSGTRNSEHIEPDILVSVQKLSPGGNIRLHGKFWRKISWPGMT